MILFTESEKHCAQSVHVDFAGAIAEAMADAMNRAGIDPRIHATTKATTDGGIVRPHKRKNAGSVSTVDVPTVFIAVYSHGLGTDLSAHKSLEAAHCALIEIARRRWARDRALRERVAAHFGASSVDAMFVHGRGEKTSTARHDLGVLVSRWSSLAPGESLWACECAIEQETQSDLEVNWIPAHGVLSNAKGTRRRARRS